MAHNIYSGRGKQSMMYVGEVPWHGLGTRLDKPPTAQEAIEAANLDWMVVKKPLYVHDESSRDELLFENRPVKFKGFYAIVPEDQWGREDCPVFGMVSDRYIPLQNQEAFSFFDPIIQMEAVTYETAGALGEGERIWVMAKIKEPIRVVGSDYVDRYLLLSNSHDGNNSVQIKFTPVRVVCQNTLTMALADGPTLRIAHTKDMPRRLQQAQQTFARIISYYEHLAETFESMTRVPMNTNRLSEYLSEIYPKPKDAEDDRAIKLIYKQREGAEDFFRNGTGNKAQGVSGTLWAAYNCVTEYIDHGTKYSSEEKWHSSVMFGSGYQTKARAFQIAESKLKGWL